MLNLKDAELQGCKYSNSQLSENLSEEYISIRYLNVNEFKLTFKERKWRNRPNLLK